MLDTHSVSKVIRGIFKMKMNKKTLVLICLKVHLAQLDQSLVPHRHTSIGLLRDIVIMLPAVLLRVHIQVLKHQSGIIVFWGIW